jgi:hypothetical protein
MISIPKQLQTYLQRAAVLAMPELKEQVAITAERKGEWDYVSPSAMKFYNMHKKSGSFGFATCQEMAKAMIASLERVPGANDVIDKVELAQMGNGDPSKSGFFLNIHLKQSYLEQQIKNVYLTDKI